MWTIWNCIFKVFFLRCSLPLGFSNVSEETCARSTKRPCNAHMNVCVCVNMDKQIRSLHNAKYKYRRERKKVWKCTAIYVLVWLRLQIYCSLVFFSAHILNGILTRGIQNCNSTFVKWFFYRATTNVIVANGILYRTNCMLISLCAPATEPHILQIDSDTRITGELENLDHMNMNARIFVEIRLKCQQFKHQKLNDIRSILPKKMWFWHTVKKTLCRSLWMRVREKEKERYLCYDPNLNYTEIRKYRKLPSFDGTFPFKLITVDLHLNEFNAEYQYSAKTI